MEKKSYGKIWPNDCYLFIWQSTENAKSTHYLWQKLPSKKDETREKEKEKEGEMQKKNTKNQNISYNEKVSAINKVMAQRNLNGK